MSRRTLRKSSPNYYVTTTANSRIKVWKLESVSHSKNEVGKLFTELSEPNYLKIHYTAIAILDDMNHCLLALGDSVGRIVLFNITTARKILEISQQTQDVSKDFKHVEGGHYSSINGLKFDTLLSENNEFLIELVSCSNDKKLCRWDLNGKLLNSLSVGDDEPSCLTVTHPFVSRKNKKKKQKYLMVASNNINVWNITNMQHQKCIGSFQGHASQTQQVMLSEDNQYLISSGHDRFVYIWKCKAFYKKKQDKNKSVRAPIFSLGLDDDVQSIDIHSITTKMNKYEISYLKQKKKRDDVGTTKCVYLICGSSQSSIKIWCFDPLKLQCLTIPSDPNSNTLKASVSITTATDTALSRIRHIRFMSDSKLLIIRGQSASMPFMKQIEFIAHDIHRDDPEGGSGAEMSFIRQFVLEQISTSVDVLSAHKIELGTLNVYEDEKSMKVDSHLTVLHVADVAIANPKSYDHYETYGKRKRQAVEAPTTDCKVNANANEPPAKKQRVDSVTFQDKLLEIERKTEEDKNKLDVKIPSADSLYMILTQSLQANDERMFERLLKMQKDEVMREFEGDLIANTLARISDKMAVDLLEKLTQKFRVSPRESIPILRWLLPLLNSHSATFGKDLSSRKYLISVNQAIDYQIKSLVPAMKLQGRLSLLTNQMDKVHMFREKEQRENNGNITAGLKMARSKALFKHDENQMNDEYNDNDLNMNDWSAVEGNDNTNNNDDFIAL